MLAASAIGVGVLVTITFFARSYFYSRGVIALFFVLSAGSVVSFRLVGRLVLRALRRRGFNLRYVLLVGGGQLAEEVIDRIHAHPEAGLRVIGALSEHSSAPSSHPCGALHGVPVLGSYGALKDVLARTPHRVDQVILALPRDDSGQLEKVLADLEDEMVTVRMLPDLLHVVTLRSSVEDLDGLPMINLRETPLVGWSAVTKRIFDVSVASTTLLLAAPLMAGLAVAIGRSAGRPVFFVQERMGLDGRLFRMIKFRTMVQDAERESGPVFASPGDGRRTRLGGWLRRTSLDELPQLWNVLRGDMSLVGPRPERPAFITQFRREIPGYMLRHKVKAGMTGWAQVCGWRGDTSIRERVEHDIYYIQNWSPGIRRPHSAAHAVARLAAPERLLMAWRIPLVDLAAEYAEVGAALEASVLRVLRSGHYVLGPETVAFEGELANLVGTRFALGVGSGSEALALSLRALGVGPGDEVVTSPFTYFATVESILLIGASPVFCDVEPGGFNLDPEALGACLGNRTRAVIPVHLFGRCADMERICAITAARDVPVIEDAAQAIGAARGGRRAGAWGTAGCFSFYPSKNLGAVGDGGGVTSDDEAFIERVHQLRIHGSGPDGSHEIVGTSSRLDSIQAAALRAKLPFLKVWSEMRARNARLYASELEGCDGIRLPQGGPDEDCVWNQYVLRCREPQRVCSALEAAGIEWRHYYRVPSYREPALGSARLPDGTCPEAERACAESVAIPIRSTCAPATIREIAGVVRRAVSG